MQDGEHITVGSKVTLVQTDTDRRVTYTLLGPWDADQKKGVISYLSPIGIAILGKRAGDTFNLELASGPVPYRVESLENGLPAAGETVA